MIRVARVTAILSALLISACSGETPHLPAPAEVSYSWDRAAQRIPEFIRRGVGDPAFQEETVVLSAVAGEGGEIRLSFRDGSPYATFRIAPETMRGATLQGRPIPAGTRVDITMRPADQDRFIVDLQPSGLRFNPRAPAELEFTFRHAAAPHRPASFTIWKQESLGEPWNRVDPVEEDARTETVRAKLGGFTRYSLASGH